MCTPMIGMLLNFAGAMAQAKGQRHAAESKAAEYEYQAKIDENNRNVALWKSADAKARGQKEEAALRVKVAALKGRQRSALAASGVEVGSGSALDILGDTAALGELDALTIRSNAERESYEQDVVASNLQANAGMKRMGAQNSRIAGKIGAQTSLLTGAGNVASKWYDYSYG
jgi:hypothetical protein